MSHALQFRVSIFTYDRVAVDAIRKGHGPEYQSLTTLVVGRRRDETIMSLWFRIWVAVLFGSPACYVLNRLLRELGDGNV